MTIITWSKPPVDIVREYFPDATDEHADGILWSRTGWPVFWAGDPETCMRQQLQEYKAKLDAGMTEAQIDDEYLQPFDTLKKFEPMEIEGD